MLTAIAHPAFETMKAVADSTIRAFREDFSTHDVECLETLAGVDVRIPFVWCARECGSHLYSKVSIEAGVGGGWSGFAKCIHTIAKSESAWSGWHLWNGYKMSKVSTDAAADLVAKWEAGATPETDAARDARYRRGGW